MNEVPIIVISLIYRIGINQEFSQETFCSKSMD